MGNSVFFFFAEMERKHSSTKWICVSGRHAGEESSRQKKQKDPEDLTGHILDILEEE